MFWWCKTLCLKILFDRAHSVSANIQTTDGQWRVWCLSSCIAFVICAMFSGLVRMWVCPGLGISILHCLPIWNIWKQSTTVVLDITCSTTDSINLRILIGWHPSALRNWITILWFSLDRFTIWYTIFKLHCNFFFTSTRPVNCFVLHKCLPVHLQSTLPQQSHKLVLVVHVSQLKSIYKHL